MNQTPKGIRVLLVDDEEVVLNTLAAFMEDWGYEIFASGNLEKTLQILKKEQIDIAVVDMRLKDCDGNTLILKAHDVQPTLKFLVHTGSACYTVPNEIAALGVGAEDVFMKPILNFNTLFDAIARKVGKPGKQG
jgi:DNA-binding NtrC family response regulator